MPGVENSRPLWFDVGQYSNTFNKELPNNTTPCYAFDDLLNDADSRLNVADAMLTSDQVSAFEGNTQPCEGAYDLSSEEGIYEAFAINETDNQLSDLQMDTIFSDRVFAPPKRPLPVFNFAASAISPQSEPTHCAATAITTNEAARDGIHMPQEPSILVSHPQDNLPQTEQQSTNHVVDSSTIEQPQSEYILCVRTAITTHEAARDAIYIPQEALSLVSYPQDNYCQIEQQHPHQLVAASTLIYP